MTGSKDPINFVFRSDGFSVYRIWRYCKYFLVNQCFCLIWLYTWWGKSGAVISFVGCPLSLCLSFSLSPLFILSLSLIFPLYFHLGSVVPSLDQLGMFFSTELFASFKFFLFLSTWERRKEMNHASSVKKNTPIISTEFLAWFIFPLFLSTLKEKKKKWSM